MDMFSQAQNGAFAKRASWRLLGLQPWTGSNAQKGLTIRPIGGYVYSLPERIGQGIKKPSSAARPPGRENRK